MYTTAFSANAECKRPGAKYVSNFSPSTNGFHFDNPALCGVDGGAGCCTGMTWATLAYYYSANHKIPAVSNIGDVPALKEWIIKATNEGVALMLPVWATKWAAHEVDFADVVSAVDRNRPVPLGLFTNAEGSLEHVSDNHSVVGYGYNVLDDQHRQVFIYDVDHAGVQCVLYNDGSGTAERWHESCQDSPAPDPEGSWLGFWVEEPFASNFRNMNRIP